MAEVQPWYFVFDVRDISGASVGGGSFVAYLKVPIGKSYLSPDIVETIREDLITNNPGVGSKVTITFFTRMERW